MKVLKDLDSCYILDANEDKVNMFISCLKKLDDELIISKH